MDISQLGNNLRLARIKHGYSQEQAAELCGISEKTLGKVERAQANISIEVLSKIEDGLGISLSELITGPPDTDCLTGKVDYYAVLEPCNDPRSQFTYGLMVCKCTPTGPQLLTIVHDISIEPRFVSEMARNFNSYQLSPIHLFDAILDRLS